MDWNSIWESIKTFFTSNYFNILNFFGILLFGIVAIKLLVNITKKLLHKTKIEKIGIQFFIGVLKFILYLVLVIVLLKIVGIDLSGFVTAISAILLAIGVALEANIANFANGIVIVSTKMFSKGDYIIVDDVEGSISDINVLFTTLITTDNRRITIPNSKIVNNSVTNNGAYKTRRVQITFSVAYESDVELVKKIVTDVMKSNGKVYLNKDIFCRLRTMSASSLDFYSYCWVDKEDYWSVYYYLMENVYNEFKRNGISVPYQQLEVRNREDEVVMPVVGTSLPPRVEKIRNNKDKFDLEEVDFVELFKKQSKDRNNQKKKTSKSKNTKSEAKNNLDNTVKSDSAQTAEVSKNEESKPETQVKTEAEILEEEKQALEAKTAELISEGKHKKTF